MSHGKGDFVATVHYIKTLRVEVTWVVQALQCPRRVLKRIGPGWSRVREGAVMGQAGQREALWEVLDLTSWPLKMGEGVGHDGGMQSSWSWERP